MSNDKVKLFVYGTLKSGGVRDVFSHLKDADLVNNQYKLEGYKLVPHPYGGYPCLVRGVSNEQVNGELWSIPYHYLSQLDLIEGVDKGLFRRVTRDGITFYMYNYHSEYELKDMGVVQSYDDNSSTYTYEWV